MLSLTASQSWAVLQTCGKPYGRWPVRTAEHLLFDSQIGSLDLVGDTEWQDHGQCDRIGSCSTGNILFL